MWCLATNFAALGRRDFVIWALGRQWFFSGRGFDFPAFLDNFSSSLPMQLRGDAASLRVASHELSALGRSIIKSTASSTVFNVCRNLWFRPFFLNGLVGVFIGCFVGLFGLGRVDARAPALPDFSSVVLSGSLASTAVSLHVLCRYILRYFCRALSPRQPCLCTGFAGILLRLCVLH